MIATIGSFLQVPSTLALLDLDVRQGTVDGFRAVDRALDGVKTEVVGRSLRETAPSVILREDAIPSCLPLNYKTRHTP